MVVVWAFDSGEFGFRVAGEEELVLDLGLSTDIDMKEIGVDFYPSNLHKWFVCPPSIAFLYNRKNPKAASGSDLHHHVVSHENCLAVLGLGPGTTVPSWWFVLLWTL